tara:strand:- start:1267 stop:1632 length:366 start_codon:yes stop_codon:yes gene_type:complete
MPIFTGNVKKILTPISKKLTIAIASNTDTCTVYNNDGSNGALTAERLYADLKTASMDKNIIAKYGVKGLDVFDPTNNGTTPQIMEKVRKNADGTDSRSVYLMLSNGVRPAQVRAKAIDIEI